VLLILLASSSGAQEVQYFPNLALGETQREHDLFAAWYTKDLKAMGEPSMLALSTTPAHAYRFLWLRTFDNPVAVRVNVGEDGSSLLTVKVASGKAGNERGVLIKNQTRNLGMQPTKWFLDQIENLQYWSQPTRESTGPGCDGAEWMLEAVKDGRYKVVIRWSPAKGPLRELGLDMVERLAKLHVSPVY
jgi:hypothetical protein